MEMAEERFVKKVKSFAIKGADDKDSLYLARITICSFTGDWNQREAIEVDVIRHRHNQYRVQVPKHSMYLIYVENICGLPFTMEGNFFRQSKKYNVPWSLLGPRDAVTFVTELYHIKFAGDDKQAYLSFNIPSWFPDWITNRWAQLGIGLAE